MSDLADPVHVIDVRLVPPPERHGLVFSAFDDLADGAWLELVSDHDPVPLYLQFERRRTGRFRWAYREAGPALWRVRITQLGLAGEPGREPVAGSACVGR